MDRSNSRVHVANMGPSWGRQDPGGPHVGHVNLATFYGDSRRQRLSSYAINVLFQYPDFIGLISETRNLHFLHKTN